MTELKLFLLGAPRVELDRKPVDLKRRKVLAPLIYLAVTRQRHRRDTLATLFWPESDQVTARASLRREFYTLTSALGNEWFTTDRDTIALASAADIWVDVEELRRYLNTWRSHNHVADTPCDHCLGQLTTAVALYQGDFLAGFTLSDCPEFDDWQFFHTDNLRRDVAGALETLAHLHCKRGDYEAAITYARRWLLLDTLHEPTHRLLMQLYAWAGQQAAALRQYQECVRLLNEELGVEPEPETAALFEAIRTRRFPEPERLKPDKVTEGQGLSWQDDRVNAQQPVTLSPPHPLTPSPRHNLPHQPTPFIGREQEVAALLDRLQDPACRLLTLVGLGGMGKTRLALQAAQRLVDQQPPVHPFGDGILFVPLATVNTASELVAAIAEATGIAVAGAASPRQHLLDALRDRRLLLILDNFEQLLDADGQGVPIGLISDLSAAAPSLKLLVTSRNALNLQEEWFHQIAGLAFPPQQWSLLPAEAQTASHYDAIRLFEQCARRARRSFLVAAEEEQVVRLCRLVEGMPLAIELAAAWLKVLSVEQVADEIEQNLDLLTTRQHNSPERHRSLRVVFEQTWQRLTPIEQQLLSQLALFQGGCTRAAAEAVTGGTLLVIGDLVDKALLRTTALPDAGLPSIGQGGGRFYYHPLLQQYALEKLRSTPALWAQTGAAHAAYYLDLLATSGQSLNSAERKATLALLESEVANIRAAWQWAVARPDLDALRRCALPLSAMFINRAQEGAHLFAQAAAALDETNPAHHAALGAVLIAQAEQVLRLGIDPAQCIALTSRALALLDTGEAPTERLKALDLLGNAIWLQGDHRQAKQVLLQGLTLARTHGKAGEVGDLLIRLGLVEREISDQTTVMAFYDNTLTELRALGDPVSLAHQLLIYGEYLVNQEQIQAGQHFLAESLQLAQAAGNTDFYPFILLHLGVAHYKQGACAEAEAYLQEMLVTSRAEERIHPAALAHLWLGRVRLAQQELTAAAAHLQEGLRLGWTHKLTLVTTLALVCFAELYDAQQQPDLAVRLLTVALNHPATEKRDQQAATRHRASLQNKLPAAEFEQAVAQGKAGGLKEAVSQVLRRRWVPL